VSDDRAERMSGAAGDDLADRFETRAVHAGLDPDPTYGSIIPAIHQTSTFVQPSVGEVVAGYDYARAGNPTRTALEDALGALEGGEAAVFASGMAATHAVLTATCGAGDHVVLPNDLYGGTFRLVDKVLSRWGLQYTMVDQTDLDALAAVVRDDTRLVWVETPTNPLLNVVDIPEVIARKRNALVAVDNTFATPANQQPLRDGADLVVHSTTKYLGGHSDVIGGAVVAGDPELADQIRFMQRAVGSVPGPFDCFLVHRGLRTLAVRMRAHAESGRAVSEWLRDAPGAADVRWPGFSGMVAFRHPDAVAIAEATRLFTLAESLGGVESLIEIPQAMTHQTVEGSDAAVPADFVRLSCGIEAPEDLVADLEAAFARVGERAGAARA
jgi:cystathionine gamma-synthase